MTLTLHDDPDALRPQIEKCISKYGWTPEHSYDGFIYQTGKKQRRAFFQSPEGYGLLVYFPTKKGECEFFSEPLAPKEFRGALIAAACKKALSFSSVTAVSLEVSADSRTALVQEISPELRIRRTTHIYTWPILDLRAYDPELVGPEFKQLRNAQNRFMREHTLKVINAASVPPATLHAIVDEWGAKRPAKDWVHSEQYHQFIDAGLTGAVGAHVFMVDGKPEALVAGWPIPNSDRTYYPFVILHSYTHWGLGEIVMLQALRWMKQKKYRCAELGGSDKKLLAFKEKFGTMPRYAMHGFTVVRSSSL